MPNKRKRAGSGSSGNDTSQDRMDDSGHSRTRHRHLFRNFLRRLTPTPLPEYHAARLLARANVSQTLGDPCDSSRKPPPIRLPRPGTCTCCVRQQGSTKLRGQGPKLSYMNISHGLDTTRTHHHADKTLANAVRCSERPRYPRYRPTPWHYPPICCPTGQSMAVVYTWDA